MNTPVCVRNYYLDSRFDLAAEVSVERAIVILVKLRPAKGSYCGCEWFKEHCMKCKKVNHHHHHLYHYHHRYRSRLLCHEIEWRH